MVISITQQGAVALGVIDITFHINHSRYMDMNNALSAFAALGQETRLRVLRLLVRAGQDGLLAGQIAQTLEVRQNTLSANLAVLSQAGLIAATREGRAIRYRADVTGIRGLLAFLMEDCCDGRPELCAPLERTNDAV